MPLTLYKRILAKLMHRPLHSSSKAYLYVVSHIAALFCIGVHAGLLLIYALHQSAVFVLINLVGILLYCFTFFLSRRRRYTAVGFIVSFGAIGYAALVNHLTGGSDLFSSCYFALVIIMQMVMPYTSPRPRVCIGIISYTFINIAIWNYFFTTPAITYPPGLYRALAIFNIQLLIVGTVFQIFVGSMVKNSITRLHQLQLRELSSQANTDPLTQLYNRRYADYYFAKYAQKRSRNKHCVALIDIDDFKKINDTYGHNCGDEVLTFLSNFLTSNLRKTDVAFRWGGEEFLIVLDNVSLASAHGILDKVRAQLENTPISTAMGHLKITLTIGVSILEWSNPQQSIADSDAKLYLGKQNGKNVVVSTF